MQSCDSAKMTEFSRSETFRIPVWNDVKPARHSGKRSY